MSDYQATRVAEVLAAQEVRTPGSTVNLPVRHIKATPDGGKPCPVCGRSAIMCVTKHAVGEACCSACDKQPTQRPVHVWIEP